MYVCLNVYALQFYFSFQGRIQLFEKGGGSHFLKKKGQIVFSESVELDILHKLPIQSNTVCTRAHVCICVLQWNMFFHGNHITEIAIICLRASISSLKTFDIQHLKGCDMHKWFIVVNDMRASVSSRRQFWHTAIEMVQCIQFISWLKLYKGKLSLPKKNLTYNTWNGAVC
jgi:hypothetical protein